MTEPAKAAALVSRQMTAGAAMVCLVQHCADEYVAALPLLMQTDDPEGAHKARVALRRLRSVLDGFRPILAKAGLARVKAEAKAMFRTLGTLRDAEIAALTLPADAAALATLRAAVRVGLGQGDAQGFARRVRTVLRGKGWRRGGHAARHWRKGPVKALAELALEVAWGACLAYGPDLAALAPDTRHGLRKDLKTLRYLCDFFAPLWPGRDAKPYFATMAALQGQLGILTDIAAQRVLIARDAATAAGQDATAAAALTEADRLWRALAALGVWWR